MMKRFCLWYLGIKDLWDVYNDGWKDGVDQHRFESETCDHHQTTFKDYWGEE